MSEFFGQILKKTRETKNLLVDEVSERTRIPAKVISALEDGRLDELPSAFYARTFVKTYARFLGVSEEKEIKDFLSGVKKKDKQVLMLKGEESTGLSFAKYRKHAGLVVLTVAVVWIAAFSVSQMKKFVKNYAAKKEKATAAVAGPEEKKAPDKIKVEKPAKTEGVELVVEARYNTWIQVRSDGRLLFRGILKKREKDSWTANDKIEFEVGNAGGVSVKINGEDRGFPGKKGEKKSVVITEDGIK